MTGRAEKASVAVAVLGVAVVVVAVGWGISPALAAGLAGAILAICGIGVTTWAEIFRYGVKGAEDVAARAQEERQP